MDVSGKNYRRIHLSRWRSGIQCLALAALVICLSGCKTRVKEANALAKQASDTADTLETYYTTLSMRSAVFAKLNHVGQPDGTTIANRLLPGDLNPDLPKGRQPEYLAADLKKDVTSVDTFFKQQLSPSTIAMLDQYDGNSLPPAALNDAIIADLNKHMDSDGDAWYPALKSDLDKVQLSDEAQALIAPYTLIGSYTLFPTPDKGPEPVTGRQRRVTINRLILDSAYPKSIKPTLSERFEAQQTALQKRQQLAHLLKTIGDALQNLTGTDASDKVKEAAAQLQQQIEAINNHPLTIASNDPVLQKILQSKQLNLDPSTLGARLFQTLAEIQQEREFRKVLPKVDTFLQLLTAFFNSEQPAYLSISANYIKAVGTNDMKAVDDPTLAIITADAKTFDPYEIKVEVHPQTGENGKMDAKAQIEQATYVQITTARQEIQDICGQLDSLHEAFQRFLVRNKIVPPAQPAVSGPKSVSLAQVQ